MESKVHKLGIIIPCFNSSESITSVCEEIFTTFSQPIKIDEINVELNSVCLIDDGSNKETKKILKILKNNPQIKLINLYRNYGQHPAITAGVLNSTEDYLITMDEDGEHNPNDIKQMLEILIRDELDIIYAEFKIKKLDFRDFVSKISKILVSWISGEPSVKHFSSFRLVKGEIFRTSAIYSSNGSFLDISISWITDRIGTFSTSKRISKRKSTYNFSGLLSHFIKLFFASGIRPLTFLFNFGLSISILSLIGIAFIIYRQAFVYIPVQGWVSNTVVLMFFGGVIISSLGLIARYLSTIVETLSGRPYFVIKSKSDE